MPARRLTKAAIALKLRRDFGFSIRQAHDVVDRLVDYFYETLEKPGGTIQLQNLGSVTTKSYAAKRVRDPRNGELKTMDPHLVWKFRPGLLLKQIRYSNAAE